MQRLATKAVLAFLVLAGCTAAALLALRPSSPSASRARTQDQRLRLPAPVKPAFTVPTPRPLEGGAAPFQWAPVVRAVEARRSPSPNAAPVARLEQLTPEGTTNIVLLTGRRATVGGRLWVHVRLPVLPNNTVGWIPRDALGGYVAVHTHLVVELDRLRATLFKNGRPIFRAAIGVGKPESPTPRGNFYIRNVLTRFHSPFYGPVAFGTSARSAVLTDWPAGGFVGIHGTNEPQLLPGRVSHGCIRMRNSAILRLARLLPVGTPLTIR